MLAATCVRSPAHCPLMLFPTVSTPCNTPQGYWRSRGWVGRVDNKWTPTAPPHPPSAYRPKVAQRVPDVKITTRGGDVYAHDQEAAVVAAAVQRLPVPRPFTMEGLVRALNKRNDRPIELIAQPLGGTVPCGWLFRLKDVDYVCYPTNTSKLHQLHIVLHEIGHLLLDHPVEQLPMLGQFTVDTGLERAAELFATNAASRIWKEQRTLEQIEPRQSPDVVALGTVFDARIDSGESW